MQTEIFDYGMNGEGVAKVDGKITLVPNTLVGELVDITLSKTEKNLNHAKVEKIITPSNARVTPPCPYFYLCGGCDLQHMSYAEQLKFKAELVKKTLKKIADIDCVVSPTVPADYDYFYRNKTSFAISDFIGFYKKKSSHIVDVDNCLISSKNINIVLLEFRKYIATKPFRPYIKRLVVRDIDGATLVGVVSKRVVDIKDFYPILQKQLKKVGLFLIINKRKDSVILTPQCTHIAGEKFIYTKSENIKYYVDILGFHQTNINVQNKLYNKVIELVKEDQVVVNGFSGEGLLSALIAAKANRVIGIEINKQSHLSAEALKRDNGIKNLVNILGDFNAEAKKYRPDLLVLDPSKKGVDKAIMKSIIGVEEIIYISCNPIALAKNLREIKNDYIIEQVIPFDMFPNTKNVETLVKLKLKEM